MLQRVATPLRRAVQNASFAGSSIPTRVLGLLVTHRTPGKLGWNTASTPRNMHGSIQLLRPMSSSAVQHDVVRRRRRKRTVNNLDPKRLNIRDIVDLNGPRQPGVSFGAAGIMLDYFCTKTPFPPNSRGFFYYHSRPGLPAGAGEIRFRGVDSLSAYCQSSADELFANGRDILDNTGHKPWRMHMLQLYSAGRYDPIRRLLLSQGLVDATRDLATAQRLSVVDLKNIGISTILDTTSDAFVMQLPIKRLSLAFIHDECITPASDVAYNLHWKDRHETIRGSDARWREYYGSAVVRFELKKAETNDMFYRVKEGEVVLVLRILELLDPAGPDEVPFRLPEGGDLAQGTSPSFYWFMPLDRARNQGIITPSSLKVLEDLYLGDSASTETTATKTPS
ncbi:hypothetical protein D9611_001951 [Ephemerocybe angulata]|uniref:Uncharacterized protein n=1 Tax=Ephemerocybe angulata TaxID=980116 RepID=A0A8H5FM35_9AGAR|nr:hypothetical protein D9611_001951 [Tulosesus angulatus]